MYELLIQHVYSLAVAEHIYRTRLPGSSTAGISKTQPSLAYLLLDTIVHQLMY